MYLMLTDETNNNPSEDIKFFAYGGLFFEIDKLPIITKTIEEKRIKSGYEPDDILKFDTNVRPTSVDIEKVTRLKQDVITACKTIESKFIVHIIHHEIIKNQNFQEHVEKAADYVIGRYNKYLNDTDNYGICIMDNLPNGAEFNYIKTKFAKGLQLDSGDEKRLDRINLYASTRVGASHAASAIDIVLGSFRYAINNPCNETVAKKLMKDVMELMWGWDGNINNVKGKGLIIRPKRVKVKAYQKDYDKLLEFIEKLLK